MTGVADRGKTNDAELAGRVADLSVAGQAGLRGSERLLETDAGAILYDPAIVNRAGPALFDAAEWRESHPVRGQGGRGGARIVADGEREFVLRHYHRGGLVGRFVDDRFLWLGAARTRPFREWRLLAELHALGLPVPRPAAAAYWRHGLSYTADLLTERLPAVRTLAEALARGTLAVDEWRRIGATVRRFHDAGVEHADLNAHNVQLAAGGEVYLLDFDRGRRREPGEWQAANLARLRRSLGKLAGAGAVRYTETDWRALLAGYVSSSA